jgi:hypothetical protein
MDTNAFVTGTVFVLSFLLIGFLFARSSRDPGLADRPSRRAQKSAKHLDPLPEPMSVMEIARAEAEDLQLSAIQNGTGLPLTAMLKTWHRDATPPMRAGDRSLLAWELTKNISAPEATAETLSLRWVTPPLEEGDENGVAEAE